MMTFVILPHGREKQGRARGVVVHLKAAFGGGIPFIGRGHLALSFLSIHMQSPINCSHPKWARMSGHLTLSLLTQGVDVASWHGGIFRNKMGWRAGPVLGEGGTFAASLLTWPSLCFLKGTFPWPGPPRLPLTLSNTLKCPLMELKTPVMPGTAMGRKQGQTD